MEHAAPDHASGQVELLSPDPGKLSRKIQPFSSDFHSDLLGGSAGCSQNLRQSTARLRADCDIHGCKKKATIPPPEFEMKSHPQSARPGDGKAGSQSSMQRPESRLRTVQDVREMEDAPNPTGSLDLDGFGVSPISGLLHFPAG